MSLTCRLFGFAEPVVVGGTNELAMEANGRSGREGVKEGFRLAMGRCAALVV